jgi:hypothetical protein
MPTVGITWRTGLCQRRHSRVVDVDDIEAAAAEHDSGDDLPDHTGTNARRLVLPLFCDQQRGADAPPARSPRPHSESPDGAVAVAF